MTREIGRIACSNLQEEIDGGELLLAMGFLDAGGELTSEMEAEEEGSDVRYITISLPKAPEARRGAESRSGRSRSEWRGSLRRYRLGPPQYAAVSVCGVRWGRIRCRRDTGHVSITTPKASRSLRVALSAAFSHEVI
jgi:hypothetical protein